MRKPLTERLSLTLPISQPGSHVSARKLKVKSQVAIEQAAVGVATGAVSREREVRPRRLLAERMNEYPDLSVLRSRLFGNLEYEVAGLRLAGRKSEI